MRYCSHCAASVTLRVPPGDSLPRFVCDACDAIYYENPKIVAGCIPEWGGQILLCRRAIEPRSGFWTFPSGFMELGESVEEAACRETMEEAGATVTQCRLCALVSLSRMNQVYIVFGAQLVAPTFAPGPESLEVDLFDPEKIPWEQMAFPVVTRILRQYLEDTANGTKVPYLADLS